MTPWPCHLTTAEEGWPNTTEEPGETAAASGRGAVALGCEGDLGWSLGDGKLSEACPGAPPVLWVSWVWVSRVWRATLPTMLHLSCQFPGDCIQQSCSVRLSCTVNLVWFCWPSTMICAVPDRNHQPPGAIRLPPLLGVQVWGISPRSGKYREITAFQTCF